MSRPGRSRATGAWLGGLLGGLGLLLLPVDALAFKEAGHRAIEAAAYRDLLKDDPAVIHTLITYGVLNPPSAPLAPSSQLLDAEFASMTVDSLVVESHFPDHLFDRQLEADRQCFHFNARGGHYKRTDEKLPGTLIPVGLSRDAYLECIGVADALLRGVLFDPRGSQKVSNGIYALMHMVEDSYADSHVARETPAWEKSPFLAGAAKAAAENDETPKWKIVYVKPWNLRTWPRYFFGNKHGEAIRSHFSAEHHMGSDTRDLGYLVGPTDENYEKHQGDADYQAQMRQCVDEAGPLIRRHREQEYQEQPITILDMQSEMVVPSVCLSQRALRAKDAVRELLKLVARLVPHVKPPENLEGGPLPGTGIRQVSAEANGYSPAVSLDESWLEYRSKFLAHYDPYLTRWMTERRQDNSRPHEPRKDIVSSSEALAPRSFHESGIGLTAELRSGTPLWVGVEEFLSRKTSSHNRPVLLLDSLGWGVQVRLPIENEMGERPAGAAVDFGAGLPLPLSELLSIQELQIYIGVRGRMAYTAQSVFQSQTRHAIELGFGGVSADFIIGNKAWFGFDAPRKMYRIDFWSGTRAWEDMLWSFSAGVAVDAF